MGVIAPVLVALGGCAGPGAAPDRWLDFPYTPAPPAVASAPCPDRSPTAIAPAAWSIALPGDVDPVRAPLPATEAERHVFPALYETLVRLECDGRLSAGLAARWQAFDGGRRWVFTLRDGATFWDGKPVTPDAVAAAWRRTDIIGRRQGEPSTLLAFDPRSDVSALPDGRVVINLPSPRDELPLVLAQQSLAVTGALDHDGWVAGSGPCRPAGPARPAGLDLLPHAGHPDRPAWPRLVLRLAPSGDPRDWLDTGINALVTRDADVVDYYEGRRDVRLAPLPWDRWYFLLTPPGADPGDRRRWTDGWSRREFAREIVRQEAEPAEFFAFAPPVTACLDLPPAVPTLAAPFLDTGGVLASRDTDLVLWPADDDDAGRLAERLAVVASQPLRPTTALPGRGPLTPPEPPAPGRAPESLAVPARDLAAHIQAGRAGALVLPWQVRAASPCDEMARMLTTARWLQEAGLGGDTSARAVPPGARAADPVTDGGQARTLDIARRLENSRTMQPLIRTRATLVAGGGVTGPAWNHDGSLRLWTGGLSLRMH